jgi:hypothetical protein
MRLLGFSVVCMILASLWACGPLQPQSTVIQPSTPAGGTALTAQGPVCFQGLAPCVPAAQFESACLSVHGVSTQKSGTPLCKVTRNYEYWAHPELSLYDPGSLPILTPSKPGGGVQTGILLKKGSQLGFSTLSAGKWGYLKNATKTVWGGIVTFNWIKANCQATGWDGMNSDGSILSHEGQPAGLFGSDGAESFYLGSGDPAKSISIHHDGYLRLGINADPATPEGCTSPGYPEFELVTCEDAAGNNYPCS